MNMEHWQNDTERGERLLPVSLSPPQIPQRQVYDRARSFVVRGRRTFA